MNEFLQQEYWGNTVLSYLITLGCVLLVYIVFKVIKKWLLVYVKKLTSASVNRFDDAFVEATEKFVLPFIFLLVNYFIITRLAMSPKVERILHVALIFVITYYAVKTINYILHRVVELYMKYKEEPEHRIKQVTGMLSVVKAFVWITGIIMLADNLGYNITTIIAGFGVGGIAVALAAQNILGDLFSYIVIFFDKPFEVGDFIIVGSNSGVVERIGIKTSHVRSLDGQQMVMPNTEMTKSVINNYKRLQRRRVVFSIGVVYNTPLEKLKKITGAIQKIIESNPKVTFDRAHLQSFGDFSINYEIVYFLEDPDYVLYMSTQQQICFEIYDYFEKNNIEFAFPTQTIYVQEQKNSTALTEN